MIEANNLSVSFGEIEILRHLKFQIHPGSWVGLIGPNGSGKTTLLRTISGLLPFEGALTIDSRSIRAWKPQELALRLAFVRQSTAHTFDFKVRDIILLGRSPHRGWLQNYSPHDYELMEQALQRVEMEGFAQRSILSLSGGELQRVLLAQALVQEADYLLLDEPTAHLDVHHRFEFLAQIRNLVVAGRTAVAVFHNLELAARFADYLLVLDRGRLVAAGPPADVLTQTLIASVFRMNTILTDDGDGALQIRYTSVIPSAKEPIPSF